MSVSISGDTGLAGAATGALNGSLGATTPSTVAATTGSFSGVATFSAGSASAPAITTTGDTNTGVYSPAADTIAWTTGGTERMRIDANGNVIVNNTSALAASKLTVKAGATAGGLYAIAETAGYVGVYGVHSSNTAGGYSAYFVNTGSSTEIYAKNTAAWNYVSDERLKTDIKDLDSTTRLLQVKPRDFLWKSQEESDDTVRRNLGFIAQEVLPIFPELVTTTPNGMYGVEYTGFIAPLIKAFQELNAKFEEYKASHP